MAEDKKETSNSIYKSQSKTAAFTGLTSTLSSGFDAISALEDYDSDVAIAGSALMSGVGSGISATFATGNPLIGGGAALLSSGLSLYKSKQHRKELRKQKAKLRRQWQAALKKYKTGLKRGKEETKAAKKAATFERENIFTLAEQAQQDSLEYAKLSSKSSPGVKDVTASKKVQASQESAHANILAQDDILIEKLFLLDEINTTIDKELTAKREVGSNFKTAHADTLEEQLSELRELENA